MSGFEEHLMYIRQLQETNRKVVQDYREAMLIGQEEKADNIFDATYELTFKLYKLTWEEIKKFERALKSFPEGKDILESRIATLVSAATDLAGSLNEFTSLVLPKEKPKEKSK